MGILRTWRHRKARSAAIEAAARQQRAEQDAARRRLIEQAHRDDWPQAHTMLVNQVAPLMTPAQHWRTVNGTGRHHRRG